MSVTHEKEINMKNELLMNSYDLSAPQVAKRQKKLEQEYKKEIKLKLARERQSHERELAQKIEDFAIKNTTTNKTVIGKEFGVDPKVVETIYFAYKRKTWEDLKEAITHRKEEIERIKFESLFPKDKSVVFYTSEKKEYINYLITNNGEVLKVDRKNMKVTKIQPTNVGGRKYFRVERQNKISVATLVYKSFVDANIGKNTTIGFLDRNPNNLHYKNLIVERKSKMDNVQ